MKKKTTRVTAAPKGKKSKQLSAKDLDAAKGGAGILTPPVISQGASNLAYCGNQLKGVYFRGKKPTP